MRMVLVVLALVVMSGCGSQQIVRDDPDMMSRTMIFHWDDEDPCQVSCIRVGSARRCPDAPDGDPCELTGEDRFATPCVRPGDEILVGSEPEEANFRAFFRPFKTSGKPISGTGTSIKVKSDALRVKYKFSVVRVDRRECRRRPVDPHIRVSDPEGDPTSNPINEPQTPEPVPLPEPVVDPGPD